MKTVFLSQDGFHVRIEPRQEVIHEAYRQRIPKYTDVFHDLEGIWF
jgi:hypothetical protein